MFYPDTVYKKIKEAVLKGFLFVLFQNLPELLIFQAPAGRPGISGGSQSSGVDQGSP